MHFIMITIFSEAHLLNVSFKINLFLLLRYTMLVSKPLPFFFLAVTIIRRKKIVLPNIVRQSPVNIYYIFSMTRHWGIWLESNLDVYFSTKIRPDCWTLSPRRMLVALCWDETSASFIVMTIKPNNNGRESPTIPKQKWGGVI